MEDFKKELKDNWNNGFAEVKKLEIGRMDYDLYSMIYNWRIGEK